MKKILVALCSFLLLLPVVTAAHPNHGDGTPAHPVGSPQHHTVETTSTEPNRAALEQQLALLL